MSINWFNLHLQAYRLMTKSACSMASLRWVSYHWRRSLIAGSISIPASANDGLGETPNGFVVGNRVSVKFTVMVKTYPLTLTKLEGPDIFIRMLRYLLKYP